MPSPINNSEYIFFIQATKDLFIYFLYVVNLDILPFSGAAWTVQYFCKVCVYEDFNIERKNKNPIKRVLSSGSEV